MDISQATKDALVQELIKEGYKITIPKPKAKEIILRPLHKVINAFVSIPKEEWEGHYGLDNKGKLTLCNKNGDRIGGGTLTALYLDGLEIYKSASSKTCPSMVGKNGLNIRQE